MTGDAYAVTPLNRVKRLHEKARYDQAAVHGVIDATPMAHIGYAIDGQPFATPTLVWRQGGALYWHGSSASRMVRHLAPGAPACVTFTQLDGLVMARSGFNHSVLYRTAMCFGTARLITDPDEKAAQLLMAVDRFFPGRSAALRPISAQETKATGLIRLDIESAVAKIADGGVEDEAEDYTHPVWAGIIPLTTVIGPAIADERLMPGVTEPGAGLQAYRPGRRLDDVVAEAAGE